MGNGSRFVLFRATSNNRREGNVFPRVDFCFTTPSKLMKKEDCFYLGKITKKFGLQGAVVLAMDVDTPEDYAQLNGLLLEINKDLVPFAVKVQFLVRNKATIVFEDVLPEESHTLVGKEAYLPLELLPKLEGNKFYFHEVKGFQVIDHEKGHVGYIHDILEYPGQPVFQILHEDKEMLLPVIDPFIEKVDRDNRAIHIKAPEGLIDMYL